MVWRALNTGAITTAQFLDLNEKIGGYDNDGNMVSRRTVGDPAAIRAAYRSGLMLNGAGGLATTPIIDYRAYRDDLPDGDIHIRYTSFSTRERLRKANGYTDNHVMLTDDRRWGDSTRAPVLAEALNQMDRWLTSLSEDTSADPKIDKVRRAKPADLVDACWTRDDKPQKIVEPATYGSGPLRGALSGQLGSAWSGRSAGQLRRREMPAQGHRHVGLQSRRSRPTRWRGSGGSSRTACATGRSRESSSSSRAIAGRRSANGGTASGDGPLTRPSKERAQSQCQRAIECRGRPSGRP